MQQCLLFELQYVPKKVCIADLGLHWNGIEVGHNTKMVQKSTRLGFCGVETS